MAWAAYLTAIGAGLLLIVFLPRGRNAAPLSLLLPPIAVAALAGAWEAAIPRSANIRVDLLLVVPLLGVVEGIFGVSLAVNAVHRLRARLPAASSAAAAAVCLAASGFVAVAWIVSSFQIAATTARFAHGDELAFQAAFRDDATQRRVFGDLAGDADGWAGYYVAEKPDVYPRRIVIAADGRYWTFWDHENMARGRRDPGAQGPERFRGSGKQREVDALDLTKAQGGVTLTRRWGERESAYGYRREAPPRFPQPPSPSDVVKFRGVFSGGMGGERDLRVAQLWIWEADGKQWGKYLWQGLTRGSENWIVAQRDARIECARRDCREIIVQVEKEMPARLTWISDDELRLETYNDRGALMVLRRGEVVPGFLYDLAPLATVAENQDWLRAIPADVHWTPPPAK